MRESSLHAQSEAARPCEHCGRREATASWTFAASVGGVPSPPLTREVCAECAAELLRVPADAPTYTTLRTHAAPGGVLAKVRWLWRMWRFERAMRRAQG